MGTHHGSNRRPHALLARFALIVALVSLCGCVRRTPLPEAGSPAASLYQARCGQCHVAYNPHSMTAAMWQVQVDAMQGKMRQAGIPPLTDHERKIILDYLTRNAGTD